MFGTLFTQPEEIVVKYGDKSQTMYFIIQGDSIVITQNKF